MLQRKRKTVTKSELIAVRMPARLKHGLDLIGRVNELNTTNSVAFAIRHFLQSKELRTRCADGVLVESLESVAEATWASDEIGRFLLLASKYPQLLGEHENALLKVVLADERLRSLDGILMSEARISEEKVREHWAELVERVDERGQA